jgi:tetratricopeptide (TPR) repeat protein
VTQRAFVDDAPLIGLDDTVLALPDTTRKYARKMHMNAIIDLSVSRANNGFVLTAEARSASTDSSLGVIVEVAKGAEDLPDAMARLGHDLRKRLVSARATLPTTKWSLNTTDQAPAAVELYLEARSEAERRNFIEAARRGEAAVQVDSTFAQAWRIVHTSLFNAGLSVDGQLKAISAAFRFSDRVRARYWRLDIISAYYRAIADHERALVFYDSIGLIAPGHTGNAGLSYLPLRRYDLAVRGYRRQVNAGNRRSISGYGPMLVESLLEADSLPNARQEVAAMIRIDSLNKQTYQARAFLFSALREWDSLATIERSNLAHNALTATDSEPGIQWLADAAIGRGEFELFDKMIRLNAGVIAKDGSLGDYLATELMRARLRATLTGDVARARAIADAALALVPWDSLKPMDRPYLPMLQYLASVGDIPRGDSIARQWSVDTPALYKRRDSLNILVGRGELALASGKAREALQLFKLADVRDCERCFYPRYGRAFDAMNEPDSARIWYEKFARAAVVLHTADNAELPNAYLRLGELYEQRHDMNAAIAWYDRFAALLATTDAPSLQNKVREAARRSFNGRVRFAPWMGNGKIR